LVAADKLTALKVKTITATGRYGDGGGLWLQVRAQREPANGKGKGKPPAKSWLFRYMLAGRARQMGLGSIEEVSLAAARDAARAARKLLHDGVDPIEERAAKEAAKEAAKQTAPAVMTFKDVTERYLAAHESSWRNEKHRWQWRASLNKYAYSVVGDRSVDQITTSDVMAILEPIWMTMPETASRLRARIESVLDYAKALEWRRGENPARWRGHVVNMLPKRNKARSVQHHPALPWAQMGTFMAALREVAGTAALALQFTVLTAARTDEAIRATWGEIDLAGRIWLVPADRMKAAKNAFQNPCTTRNR
jgi:hypothetical protein